MSYSFVDQERLEAREVSYATYGLWHALGKAEMEGMRGEFSDSGQAVARVECLEYLAARMGRLRAFVVSGGRKKKRPRSLLGGRNGSGSALEMPLLTGYDSLVQMESKGGRAHASISMWSQLNCIC